MGRGGRPCLWHRPKSWPGLPIVGEQVGVGWGLVIWSGKGEKDLRLQPGRWPSLATIVDLGGTGTGLSVGLVRG